MALVIVLLTLLLVAAVMALVGAPLRRARTAEEAHLTPGEADLGGGASAHMRDGREQLRAAAVREELEAAREAKYRELRDVELDYRTGKLSERHYRAIDSELRVEAIAILDRLERWQAENAGGPQTGSPGRLEPGDGGMPEPGDASRP